MNLRSFIAIAIFSTVSFAASAQVRRSLPADNARIYQGVRSGELTRAERTRLKGKEARVRHDERAARANGVVTRRERNKIQRDKKNLSRSIYRQKHDAQVRP